MMKFNKYQLDALDTPINKNVIVSAGAGSGKTSTLTEKVYRLIKNKELEPSELLVLTFTKNAAHSMQEKIINKFDDELSVKMMSSHIQTFDSFAQDLVKEFSSELKLSNNIMIANEDVINTKKRILLDKIIIDILNNKEEKTKFIETFRKYNLKDLSNTKEVILDIYDKLKGMIPSKKEEFIKQAREVLFTQNYFDKLINKAVSHYKNIIDIDLAKTSFIAIHNKEIESFNFNNLKNYFLDCNNFKTITFITNSSNKTNQTLLNYIFELRELNSYPFINKYKEIINQEKYQKAIKKTKKSFKEDESKDLSIYLILKELLKDKLSPILDIQNKEKEYQKLLSSKNDVILLLDIANKLYLELMNYKKTTNCFTFDDVAKFALSLLTKKEYEHIAKKIRNRYKFIMIDEYQDTNDLQEEVINSLMKEKDDGSRANLFCVGDAKQSIYAFRNSNVELFRNRLNEYKDNKDNHKLIPMNINYRSVKPLIDDINYIFSFYMSKEHGNIDYNNSNETLIHEGNEIPNSNNQTPFNIIRILKKSNCKLDEKNFEIEAIIADIKKKISNKTQVYDAKTNSFRDCKLSDFTILMSKKAGFKDYQKSFLMHGIELNNKTNTNLVEIDVIEVLQSLLSLISYIIYENKDADLPHLYVSIARSYIYQLSDQEIFNVISNKKDDYQNIKDTEIYKKAFDFVKNNYNIPLNEIFTNLINEFNVIERMYLIGNVNDNIAKIESLYNIALSEESAGEGIYEFTRLFKDINKYELDLTNESTVNIVDAVDMMTIHAAKGLENKIIYLPYSYIKLGGDNNFAKKDYIFNKDIGIILPYYEYDNFDLTKNVTTSNIASLVNSYNEDKSEIDEFVRLLYVALTRAENTIYIVGGPSDKPTKEMQKETLYGMLYHCPYYTHIDESFINKMIINKAINKNLFDKYLSLVSMFKNSSMIKLKNAEFLNNNNYEIYNNLYNQYYIDLLNDELTKTILEITIELNKYYHSCLLLKKEDINFKAKLFATYSNVENINNYNDLLLTKINDIDENINHLFDEVLNDKVYLNKKDECDQIKLLNLFLQAFENKDYYSLFSLSFKSNNYLDKHYYVGDNDFDLINNANENNIELLNEENVNDTQIEFKERVSKKASITVKDEDLPDEAILERGSYLHSLLELVDLKTKDTSFINNLNDKKIIDAVLTNEIFDLVSDNSKVYKEYGYFDNISSTTGFIDLLIIKDNEYYIIDYKSRHTDNDGYKEQLETYQRNIMNIFNVSKDKIHLYLLSILDNKLIELK